MEEWPGKFAVLPSFTTRNRRPGEPEDEYRFLSMEKAESLLKTGEVLQHVLYNGELYGTLAKDLYDIWQSGKTPVRIVEPTGVQQFSEALNGSNNFVFSIYVNASKSAIIRRWLGRWDELRDQLGGEVGEKETEFFVSRVLATVDKEWNWVNEAPYSFYYDSDMANAMSLRYALGRIAMGKVDRDMIPRLSPKAV